MKFKRRSGLMPDGNGKRALFLLTRPLHRRAGKTLPIRSMPSVRGFRHGCGKRGRARMGNRFPTMIERHSARLASTPTRTERYFVRVMRNWCGNIIQIALAEIAVMSRRTEDRVVG